MQAPHFLRNGLDISIYHSGTINLSISPKKFKLFNPQYTFKEIHWAEGFPPEDFSFSKCIIRFRDRDYNGLIYYPRLETKIGHRKSESTIETLMPFIENLKYGDNVEFHYNDSEIEIFEPDHEN